MNVNLTPTTVTTTLFVATQRDPLHVHVGKDILAVEPLVMVSRFCDITEEDSFQFDSLVLLPDGSQIKNRICRNFKLSPQDEILCLYHSQSI